MLTVEVESILENAEQNDSYATRILLCALHFLTVLNVQSAAQYHICNALNVQYRNLTLFVLLLVLVLENGHTKVVSK